MLPAVDSADVTLGHRDDALDVLHCLLQAMPLNSGLVEALMRPHLAAGDRTAADGVYQEHTKALDHASLGDPDDAVEELRLTFSADV